MKVALEKFENYLSGWVPQGIKYVTIEEDEWIHETRNAVADPKPTRSEIFGRIRFRIYNSVSDLDGLVILISTKKWSNVF